MREARDWDYIAGVGTGALAAYHLARSPKGNLADGFGALRKVWREAASLSGQKPWRFLDRLQAVWRHHQLSSDEHAVPGRTLRVGALSYHGGRYQEVGFEVGDELPRWVCASIVSPGLADPVLIDGDWWFEGSVHLDLLVRNTIRAGARDIDVVLTCPLNGAPPPPPLSPQAPTHAIVYRALELAHDRAAVAAVDALAYGRSPVGLEVFYPEEPLHTVPLEDLQVTSTELERLVRLGAEAAEARDYEKTIV